MKRETKKDKGGKRKRKLKRRDGYSRDSREREGVECRR
jgi:hypothetical protein